MTVVQTFYMRWNLPKPSIASSTQSSKKIILIWGGTFLFRLRPRPLDSLADDRQRDLPRQGQLPLDTTPCSSPASLASGSS